MINDSGHSNNGAFIMITSQRQNLVDVYNMKFFIVPHDRNVRCNNT